MNLQNIKVELNSKSPLASNKIIYLVKQSNTRIFCSESLEIFNLYRRFVENTIIQLGQDWRIQSGLLAQQIIAEKNLTNDQFCIFNEFMAVYLRKRLGTEESAFQPQNLNKIVSEEEGQQEFLKYFDKSLGNNTSRNSYEHIQQEITNNLTFKTLSLGFYITASDTWMRTFKKFYRSSIEQKIKNISFDNEKKLGYFASLDLNTQQWLIQPQENIQSQLGSDMHRLEPPKLKGQQNLSKSIRLGSVVVNVSSTVIIQAKSPHAKTIRVFSLCTEFYLFLFSTWLIFSIKKSFNSNLFSQTCFVRYCDIIIGDRISDQKGSRSSLFHPIYKQFKQLCDRQWKNLMEDYMVAMNDDKQILKVLIKKIGQKIEERFAKQIVAKKMTIRK